MVILRLYHYPIGDALALILKSGGLQSLNGQALLNYLPCAQIHVDIKFVKDESPLYKWVGDVGLRCDLQIGVQLLKVETLQVAPAKFDHCLQYGEVFYRHCSLIADGDCFHFYVACSFLCRDEFGLRTSVVGVILFEEAVGIEHGRTGIKIRVRTHHEACPFEKIPYGRALSTFFVFTFLALTTT